jgi:hypothetical protein
MDINASELTEVLAIVNQYESDAYIFTYKGLLYIDGLQAAKKMTQYERSVLTKHGFVVCPTNAIHQVRQTKPKE